MPDTALNAVISALAAIAAVEVFFRTGFISALRALHRATDKALRVVGAKQISDHWKERVLPRYAGAIAAHSLLLFARLLLLLTVFLAVYLGLAALVLGEALSPLAAAGAVQTQLFALVFAVGYAWLRGRLGRA